MSKFVVDASVAMKWFVPEVYEAEAKRFLAPNNVLFAPDLLPSECGNILWKKVRRGEITDGEAYRIAAELQNAPLVFVTALDLLSGALQIAVSTGRTVYDSLYVALAVAQQCRLVTADQKLYNALQSTPYGKRLLWVGG
jgi:predicted nucleic acid-binding protein